MVDTPLFSPEGGSYTETQIVTISCETEGAIIYYTLDGTNPTENSEVYNSPLTISETTIVKAVAMKDGYDNSAIATTVYFFSDLSGLITIAEARALENDEYALVQGVVTIINGRYIYIQDVTAGIVLYLNSNTVPSTLALGDIVQAYGKHEVY